MKPAINQRALFGWGLHLFLLACTLPAHAGTTTVPAWVKQAAAEVLPAYSTDTKAVVLLEETTLNVQPEGRSTEHVRRVVKILRPQGREYGEVVVWFNANSKINYLHVWSIGPDGHEYALKDNDISERGTSSWGVLYQDARAKVATAPGRDVNGVIAYEYEQRVPFYESEDSWNIQEVIPKHKQRFILQLPQGWEYTSAWHQHPAIEPVANANQIEWNINDVGALDLQDVLLAPSAAGLRARGVISYFCPGQPRSAGDWRAIGAAYQRLAQDRALPSPEISAKAQELVAGKSDFADRVQAIGEFVQQQIRYVAIEIGIGGLQPHAASEIFHTRSGDCKDKATLLAAMLGSVGVHSTWVLVDTRRGFMSPDAPSMEGNHAIAAIELPAGYSSDRLHSVVTARSGKHFLIFDPTWEFTPFGVLEAELQGGYGILVDGKDSELLTLPVLAPELNSMSRQAVFNLADDGSLTGKVTVRRSGDLASKWRSLYHDGSEKERRRKLEDALGRDLGSFTLDKMSAENATQLTRDFIQQYDLTVPLYARSTGTLVMVRPRVIGIDSPRLDEKIRTYPVDMGETRNVKDEFELELPAGFAVDELPDPVSVDIGFAAYQSHTEMHGSTLHYSRQYVVRQIEVPAEKYQALRQLIGQIEQDERSVAVFKRVAGPR